jgi:NAD(P)-dependent dehydrogenase (short-subunit alcohol dehydrogenase family)
MSAARVALVTGGNRGIGFEICRQLAEAGCAVVLTARDEAKAVKACARLAAVRAHPQQLDVTDSESVRRAVADVEAKLGRLDILVNNAGIAIDAEASLADAGLDVFRSTLETNLFGPLRLCQACIPLMKRQGYGRIVNVSSGRGSFARLAAGGPCYRISKTALNALTKILADELKETNILVNAMTPGWVRTGLGGLKAPRSPREGADTAVWLALLPDDGPRGGFWKDREEFPW